MKHVAAFMSEREDWATPQAFFDHLNTKYGFTLDACATADNAKCPNYFTPDDDALTKRWKGTVFCNPPYSHNIGRWVRKAREEALRGATVVMLIPARTDTSWFHKYIFGGARELYFVSGRLRFSGSNVNAPFPSCVAVFGGASLGSSHLQIGTMSRSGEILSDQFVTEPRRREFGEFQSNLPLFGLGDEVGSDMPQDERSLITHAHPTPCGPTIRFQFRTLGMNTNVADSE
jgi:phage N-6-adenine-methyltransferase